MTRADLIAIVLGLGLLGLAYSMKQGYVEGFQYAPPPAGPPPASTNAPATPVPAPPAATAGAPPPGPPPPGPPPPGPPPGPPPPAPMQAQMPPPSSPQPMAMKPNQQQLMDISQKVDRIASQNMELGQISRQLKDMTTSFVKESFQSYQNPYTAASPSDSQAMEFRLGKKELADTVMRY